MKIFILEIIFFLKRFFLPKFKFYFNYYYFHVFSYQGLPLNRSIRINTPIIPYTSYYYYGSIAIGKGSSFCGEANTTTSLGDGKERIKDFTSSSIQGQRWAILVQHARSRNDTRARSRLTRTRPPWKHRPEATLQRRRQLQTGPGEIFPSRYGRHGLCPIL